MRPFASRLRRRRTWVQRGVIALNILLVMVCLLAAGALSWFKQQYSEIKRVDLGGTLSEQAASPSDPTNFLLVGVDNTFGLAANDPVQVGRNGELNTDTIMLLRVDPSSHKAWILSFPRDLLVTIPGSGGKSKINSALSIGGPQKLVETIQTNFNIKVNHYAQVNLAGFEQLVNAIGGVPVNFTQQGRDTHSGLAPIGPGCVTLDGATALQFARSRYYETLTFGQWTSDPASDLGRIRRQQEFMRAAIQKAIDRGATNPFVLRELISTAQKNVVLDLGVTTQMLLDLGAEFRDFDPAKLEVITPPVDRFQGFGMDALTLRDGEAQPIFDIFRGANPLLNILKTVRIEVRNGNGSLGFGKKVADDLNRLGFTAKSVDNPLYKSDKMVIKYDTGNDAQQTTRNQTNAVVLARYFDGDVSIVEDSSITGDSPIALIVPKDYKPPRDLNSPRPLTDFTPYLPPALQEKAAQTAAAPQSPTAPTTLLPTTTASTTPSNATGDCR